MKNILKTITKNLSKKKIIIFAIILLICIISIIMSVGTKIRKQIIKAEMEKKPLLEYEIKNKENNGKYDILVKINSADGLETVKYISEKTKEEVEINCHNKMKIAIDYQVEDLHDYNFIIKKTEQEETTEVLHFEIPRIQGTYSNINGIYSNEPDLTGYNKNYTKYLSVEDDGTLTNSNWISEEKPSNWYDYKNSKWANILVEENGQETYYTWIPRYCFKLDQEAERSDVKFIDIYNNYTDEQGNVTNWETLEEEGYQVPEAFEFDNKYIPGYWAMKYTAGERDTYTINYETTASKKQIFIRNIKIDTSEEIAKYVYAVNGNVIKESTTAEDINYEISTENVNIVNVTAVNSAGEIIGSMTKECKQAKINEPELTGYNTETTFYVTYDENGNEHSTIPITQEKPEDWYDYGDSKWANIVTRNNGLETYYTWIPRYEFKLDQTSERSNVNFIEGTSTQASDGYQIPEAFTFDGKQLSGYWAMKYTAGDEAAPTFDTEVAATSSSIKTKGITGTKVAEGQTYKYYLNGEYKGEKTSSNDWFEFTGLSSDTKYTVLVEIRNASDEYIGTVVKQISTIEANKPDLSRI